MVEVKKLLSFYEEDFLESLKLKASSSFDYLTS